MKRKIIIDTDPGQDDAVAILLALAAPDELDVLAVVAVAGNVGLAQNAKNALKVVELSGRTDVPVYAGSVRPMRRTPCSRTRRAFASGPTVELRRHRARSPRMTACWPPITTWFRMRSTALLLRRLTESSTKPEFAT